MGALRKLATSYECGARFNLQHALSCKKGGFISIRHNQIRNITAKLLKEVCKDTCVQAEVQQPAGETLQSSTFTGNEIPSDICARGFW